MTTTPDAEAPDRLRSLLVSFSTLFGTSGIVLGCFVLLGWRLEGQHLLSAAGLLSLTPITGAVFVMTGFALRLSGEQSAASKRLMLACAGTAFALALLELAGFLGWETGIDALLLHSPFIAARSFVRADLSAVLNSVAISAALLTLDVETRGGHRPAQFLCVIGLALTLMTLGGYGYGLQPLSAQRSAVDVMEVNAALSFALLNLGILFARPDRGLMALALSEEPGGSTVRLLLPAMIIVPTILAWVRILVQKLGYYNTSTGAALFALAASMIYVALILWNASSIDLASKERRRADARTREAAEMKTEFVAIVSHELRTPLTSIKIVIDVVHDDPKLTDAERKNYLSVAKRNVDRLARLINEVLDFQKLEAGREEFNLLPHGINEIVAEVAETFAPVVREKGLELTTVLAPGLPPVVCDRDKISQVLINLTNNAVKFCGRGRVTLRTERADGALRFSVHDEGPGISPEDQKRLFKSFSQVVNSGKAKEGTGLGLAICRKIIEHHDGSIGVESASGKGTTFFFALPYGKERGGRS